MQVDLVLFGDMDGDGLADFTLALQAGKAIAAGDFIF